MPTKIELTLDASTYRKQLDEVVAATRAAAENMSAGLGTDQKLTVTADTTQAEKALSELSDKTGQSTSRFGILRKMMSGGFSSIAGQIKSGAGAISAIGAAAGISIPPVGMLGALLNVLLSPITLITAALTGLVAVGTRVWDKLTVSVEEYSAQTKLASEAANRELEKFKELDASAGSYLTRLKELSSADLQGNSAKAETAQLLETLQNRYGDLGAKIDETTGKITNMAEVEDRLNAKRNRQAAQKYAASADASMNEARAAYMKAAGQGYFGERRAGRKFDEAAKSMTPDQLLKYMENRAKNGATEAEIKNYSEVANHLRRASEAMDKARNVLGSGQESGIKAEQETAKKVQSATAAKQARDTTARQFAERKSDDEFAQEKDIGKKKANRQARIDAEKKNEAQYQKELDTARDTLARIQKDKGKPGYDAGAEADAVKAVADAERKVLESQAKQYSFKYQMQQLDKARDEAAKKMVDSAKFEVEYARLIAKSEYDKAAALKLEHELKQQNLKLSEKERNTLLEQQKTRKALALQSSYRDKAMDLKWQMMDKAGRGKQAAEERALRDAEQNKGRKLTDQETAFVRKFSELTWNLDNRRETQFGDLSIKTNSLTARGGFASGAVTPDSEKYQRITAENGKNMLSVVQRIETICRDFGKF